MADTATTEQSFIDWAIFGPDDSTATTSRFMHTAVVSATSMAIYELFRGRLLNAIGGAELVKSRNVAAAKVVKDVTPKPQRLEDMR